MGIKRLRYVDKLNVRYQRPLLQITDPFYIQSTSQPNIYSYQLFSNDQAISSAPFHALNYVHPQHLTKESFL